MKKLELNLENRGSVLAAVSRIGCVPRVPVVELGGMGAIAMAGQDFDQAPWPTHYTLERSLCDYSREWAQPEGVCLNRIGIAARDWMIALDPQADASKLTRADGRAVVAHMLGRGMKPASARRNMAIGIAAMNHAKREERIVNVPEFSLPKSGSPRMRWLTPEEVTRLMQVPKAPRIQRFFILAFGTGCRSEAIEQLTWDRVNFKARTIDFRLPGVNHKNKKRPIAPINDALLPRLEAMFARRKDDYVIGLGDGGGASSSFGSSSSSSSDSGSSGSDSSGGGGGVD